MPGLDPERETFFEQARALTPFVAVHTGFATVFVSTADGMVGRTVFVKRKRGDATTLGRVVTALRAFQLDRCIDGGQFIDIGANIGTTTLAALLAHPFATGVAVEPSEENYRLLRVNLAYNGIDRQVTAIRAAASDRAGTALLALHDWNWGGHQVVAGSGPLQDGDDAPGNQRESVETITLDALVELGVIDPRRPGLLWIDAQGHEGHILAGARRVRATGMPVLTELYPALLHAADGMDRFLQAATEDYTHFIEITKSESGFGEPVPIERLRAFTDTLGEQPDHPVTDILLVYAG